MPARNLIVLVISAIVSLLCYRTAARNHYGGLLASAIGEINESFVTPVDDRDLFEGAMDGMVRQLDPYSDYISPRELLEFQEDLDQKFGGIGIVVEVDQSNGKLTVLSPLPDTPAFEAGIRAGDIILAIDGESTDGFQIYDAVERMRGEAGTKLTVTILHAGATETEDLELERAIIPIASVLGDLRNPDGSWQFTLAEHPEIGYIRLASFGEKTSTELRETLTELLPRIEGLILDLRGNGGGLLNAAIEVCDMFVNEGLIVSIRGRDQRDWRNYEAAPADTLAVDLPLVILVDGYSASASEITAACLQDLGRAIVVGQRSWGKGTVQNVMPFEGGKSAIKLTVATYWRPSGENIHRHRDASEEEAWGVSPNDGYAVKLSDEELRKVILYRRNRDKVEVETPDEEVGLVGSAEPTTEATDLPDLTGFEDPQLKRAIEALQELLRQARNKTA